MQQKGMVWVIGASGGLGRATAQAFAQNGWSVIAGARSFAAGTSPLGEGVTVLPLDVTNDESCTAFTEKALGMENRVDVLVCAAAQLVLGSCENTTVDELDKLLNVNVLGTVRMIQRALPLMRTQKAERLFCSHPLTGFWAFRSRAPIPPASTRWKGTPSVWPWRPSLSAFKSVWWSRAITGAAAATPVFTPKMKRTPFTGRRMKTPAPSFITTKKTASFRTGWAGKSCGTPSDGICASV